MKLIARTALATAVLALAASPALGAGHVPPAGPPAQTPGSDHAQNGTTGPQQSGKPTDTGKPSDTGKPTDAGQPADVPPSQAKALGRTECTKLKASFAGKEFGQCIAAVARGLESGVQGKAGFKAACSKLSHKPAKGHKRSPFSACVAAGAKALQSQK